MSSIASKIRDYIKSLGQSVVFATKQLLRYGSRNAVDKALSRLVSKRLIKRLAFGVFIAESVDALAPSAYEIANVKAIAFGKRIIDQKIIQVESVPVHHFLTDGCRSSFNSTHGRLFFDSVSAQQFQAALPKKTPVQYFDITAHANNPNAASTLHLAFSNAEPQQNRNIYLDNVRNLSHVVQLGQNRQENVAISNNSSVVRKDLVLANGVGLLQVLVTVMLPFAARPVQRLLVLQRRVRDCIDSLILKEH